jgi:tetratricopeptide (TPR) repeat protein
MVFFNKKCVFFKFLLLIAFTAGLAFLDSCSSFRFITYDKNDTLTDDPEPNYSITLNSSFQEYTNFMFIGNRIENFGTYFNTYYNAEDNYALGYEQYEKRILSKYSERLDSVFLSPPLPLEAKDDFNNAIEKASKVIQFHKSSAFMDKAVLLIGKSYYFLGDYLKAERKFNEFISKLYFSPLVEETYLYLARTQFRLKNTEPALEELNRLISTSKNTEIVAAAHQSLAEYYISQKDYESAIKNYKKSIELSSDNSFKAQMQFLIASVIARTDPLKGAEEYQKVLDYSVTYDLEYLSKYNAVKYSILGGNFTNMLSTIEKLIVKYKDDQNLLPEVNYLKGLYYEQKKDYKNAVKEYEDVIKIFPKTVSSADASYSVAKYYEDIRGDYLNAYRFYRYSTEESAGAHNYYKAFVKTKIFKKYFDLRSVIADTVINSDYDSSFYLITQPNRTSDQINPKVGEEKKGDQGIGKPGGISEVSFVDTIRDKGGNFDPLLKNPKLNTSTGDLNPQDTQVFKTPVKTDTLQKFTNSVKDTNITTVDSAKIKMEKHEKILTAKFELSELFIYDLNRTDSAEFYLNQAYEGSEKPDFKCKVLFALANLYLSENRNDKADETLRLIIRDYPLTYLANESRKLLNLPLVETDVHDEADSIYNIGESYFTNNNYPEALSVFKDIVSNHLSSKYYLNAAYACGWIYENVLFKADTAYDYYSKLLKSDPTSSITKLIVDKVAVYKDEKLKLEDSLKIISDSLKIGIQANDSLKTDSLKANFLKPDSLKTDSLKLNLDTADSKSSGNNDIKTEDDNTKIQNGTNPEGMPPENNGDINKNKSDNPDLKKEENQVPNPEQNK